MRTAFRSVPALLAFLLLLLLLVYLLLESRQRSAALERALKTVPSTTKPSSK